MLRFQKVAPKTTPTKNYDQTLIETELPGKDNKLKMSMM